MELYLCEKYLKIDRRKLGIPRQMILRLQLLSIKYDTNKNLKRTEAHISKVDIA